MSDSFGTPWIVTCQALLPLGFLRQEYWSGLPFPFPGDLPNPGTEPASPSLAGGFFTTEPLGKLSLSESLTKETKGDEVLAIYVPEADIPSFVLTLLSHVRTSLCRTGLGFCVVPFGGYSATWYPQVPKISTMKGLRVQALP